MNKRKVRIAAAIVVVAIVAITAAANLWLRLDYAQTVATLGVLFSIAAFTALMYMLYATYVQLGKSQARPRLDIAFTESGGQDATIRIKSDKYTETVALWAANSGNAVARLFQVELEVPDILEPQFDVQPVKLAALPPRRAAGVKNTIVSFYNDGQINAFPGRPVQLPGLRLEVHPRYLDADRDFALDYRIYGDWEGPYRGQLRLHFTKQEVTDATG